MSHTLLQQVLKSKNPMKSSLIVVGFLCVTLSSCSEEIKNEKSFEYHEVSEMASLMKQMVHINEQLKKRIELGEDLGVFPENFEKILSSKMTKNQEMDDFFKKHAQEFLKTHKAIYENPEQAAYHYNLAIEACIECHREKCPGPVTRIEKLKIVENN